MITPEQLAKSGSEDAEQAALFQWAALQRSTELRLMFSIPNGGKRDKITAARLKATGVKAGVPDVFLPVARGDFNGLFIELKRRASYKPGKMGKTIVDKAAGVTSDKQDEWAEALTKEGFRVVVAFGWQDAAAALSAYLDS